MSVKDNSVNAEILYKSGDGEAMFIAALYDGGRLIECKCESTELTGDVINKTLTFRHNAEDYEVRAFLWQALDGENVIKPLFETAKKYKEE